MTESPQFVVNVEAAVYRPTPDDERRGGEFLLAERSSDEDHAAGLLSLVGGKVEVDEPTVDVFEQTVRRELHEEVGVTVDRLAYLSSVAFQADTGADVVNVVFLAEYADGEARPREPDEVASVHWLTLDDARQRESLPEFTEYYLAVAADRLESLGWPGTGTRA